MLNDDWFFTAETRAARDAMHAAHTRLSAAESRGADDSDRLPAAREAMRAESAYFRLVPAHRYADGDHPLDKWDVAEAEASRLEGFTPGDPD